MEKYSDENKNREYVYYKLIELDSLLTYYYYREKIFEYKEKFRKSQENVQKIKVKQNSTFF